jgi:hypothetical protein
LTDGSANYVLSQFGGRTGECLGPLPVVSRCAIFPYLARFSHSSQSRSSWLRSFGFSEGSTMKRGRPTRELFLSKGERDALNAWTVQPRCPLALALRARIILLCSAGRSNNETAEELHFTIQTVGKWRQRFIEKRLDGLLDEPRPETPKKTERCRCRSCARDDNGACSRQDSSLVDAIAGRGERDQPCQHPPHLAGVFSATAPHRGFQAVERFVDDGQVGLAKHIAKNDEFKNARATPVTRLLEEIKNRSATGWSGSR